jgi:P63C domain
MGGQMSSAERVIAKFGNQSALARLLGKGQSTIQHWVKSGTIPAKWHSPLLKLAEEQGLELTPSDFLTPVEIVEDAPVLPTAKWMGFLQIGEVEIPCYVLDDGRRVISRTGATGMLTKTSGGNLETYLSRKALGKYIPPEVVDQMVDFNIPEVANKTVRGISAETFLDICRAYVQARDDGALQTESQVAIAIRAGVFISACAKVGLIALIDEATGYQYERAQDALKLKLKIYLEDEMRKWEKTFPDELWREFARLTNWKGSVTQRPKYWGKLVMELVYEYLDKDVALWLKENAPKPRSGMNYHQWLSSQYGLKKLVEHLWMLIGMASACHDMAELRQRMAEKYGRSLVQLTLYLPPPKN